MSIAALLVLLIMLSTTVDALGRYIFDHPFKGVFEGTEFALGWIAFLSFAYVQRRRANISINLISRQLPRRVNIILEIFLMLVALFIFFIIAWSGWVDAMHTLRAGDRLAGMVDWPIGPAKFIVPVGSALLSLRLFRQLLDSIAQLFTTPKGQDRATEVPTIQGETI
ncbi:MAG: TRAP transporter small permease [Chloroflexota bacterium]